MKKENVIELLLKAKLLDVDISITNGKIYFAIYANTLSEIVLSEKKFRFFSVFEKYILENIEKWKEQSQYEIDKGK